MNHLLTNANSIPQHYITVLRVTSGPTRILLYLKDKDKSKKILRFSILKQVKLKKIAIIL